MLSSNGGFMEMIICKCGCGKLRDKFDSRGRERLYISGHQNKEKSIKQLNAASSTINRVRPKVPWNKGKSYVMSSIKEYANKGAWSAAMKRVYKDKCMCCEWDKAKCDIHHIIHKSNGGKFTLDNGVILCPNCHRLAHTGVLTEYEISTNKNKSIKNNICVI